MSKYAGILAMGKKRYPSLVFDFAGLNNMEEYYREYKIPAEEKPIVYAYSGQFFSFRLEGSGTLITDEAIYFHPSHHDWAKSNRFPLSDICSYMVFKENDRDGVHLISRRNDLRIFGRTVAPQDSTATELFELLKALQKALITGSNEKKEFDKTLSLMLGRIRSSFHENGMLDTRYSMLLDQICEYQGFATEVAFIRAEHLYRMCNKGVYFKFVDELSDDVDSDVKKSLRNPQNLFFDNYISDISNSAAFYMTKALIEPYLNLKGLERLDLNQCLILCFLCIRLDDDEYFEEIFNMIAGYIQPDDFWKLVGFRARYKNEKMSGVYERLLSDVPLSQHELELCDSAGLTPLHYALITRDDKAVNKLLDAFDWSKSKGGLKDTDTGDVYEFTFAAACLFDDRKLIRNIILRTTPEAKPLARAIKSLNTSIDIKSNLLRRAMEKDDLEDTRLYQEEIAEYRKLLDEVDGELNRLVDDKIKVSRKQAESIISENHPMKRYIMHLYMMPDALYRSIADTISSWRVFRYKDNFFVASCDRELMLSYYEWQNGHITARIILESDVAAYGGDTDSNRFYDNDTFVNPDRIRRDDAKRKENEKRQRRDDARRAKRRAQFKEEAARAAADAPYGRSFFSPQAHNDIKLLKQEYRRLVKRYHPDAGGDSHDVEIMLVIMNERADILERMT